MMAAVLAEGTTTIENAAEEPEIVDLANFLNTLGADVRGAGTRVIQIHGVPVLGGGTYTITPTASRRAPSCWRPWWPAAR